MASSDINSLNTNISINKCLDLLEKHKKKTKQTKTFLPLPIVLLSVYVDYALIYFISNSATIMINKNLDSLWETLIVAV